MVAFSVLIPTRNDWPALAETVESIWTTRTKGVSTEFVVVDDASTTAAPWYIRRLEQDLPVRVMRSRTRLGIARARNLAAEVSRGEVLFITDSHVRLSPGWDADLVKVVRDDSAFAATITDGCSSFRASGCSLVVPFMGTRWNRYATEPPCEVQIASSAGTILPRSTFWAIGGYDEGMLVYGAAEPEFSVRLWLSGFGLRSLPEIVVTHRFKPPQRRNTFLREARTMMVHNNLRFGYLYLNDLWALTMTRHYAHLFPDNLGSAVALLNDSDVWARRRHLRKTLSRRFQWFVDHFDLHDQSGNPFRPVPVQS